MPDHFTNHHLALLNQWKGHKRDESNQAQNAAYEELKNAYAATQAWAQRVKDALFPVGRVEIRKRPTTQGNQFAGYLWARIYPSPDAPKELAYTVSIDGSHGFTVDIDTINLPDTDPRRLAYMQLRGADGDPASLVARLSAADGIAMSLSELADWSVNAIRKFKLRYEDVAARAGFQQTLSDEDLLKHFDGKPAFQTFRASWSPQEKSLFCRLARAVHSAGLDWWHMTKDIQVRFGRKHPGSERAVAVLGSVRGTRARKISWFRPLGAVSEFHRVLLTDELVSNIEAALASERHALDAWLGSDVVRPGLWPDQLKDDSSDAGADVDGPDDQDDPQDDDANATGGGDSVMEPVNRIYYGPPGTGKTFELSKLLQRVYEEPMAAMSPDEWRQQTIATRVANLTWWEGTAAALFELGGHAKVGQLHDHPFIQAIAAAKGRTQNVRQTLWGTLQNHAAEDSPTIKYKLRVAPAVFDKTTDSVWHFAGEWKEACADIIKVVEDYRAGPPASGVVRRYSFVTFHQSYGYEEFVEGLRPVLGGDVEAGAIRYEIRPGAFKALCARARAARGQRFAVVIDEINRGNISKIFGELITLIEADKREGAKTPMTVTLPYSGESFSVPPNVDIIGTMNTADRSLALLDTALRRRFEFVPVMPDARDVPGAPLAGLRVRSGDYVIEIPRMLDAINKRIEALYDRDHCIGHAYFTSLASAPDGDGQMVALQQLFKTRIVPLLEEYFFEDWQKIRLVLADNQKPDEMQFVRESDDQANELNRLFGNGHGLDNDATKRRYTVQDAAFAKPQAYIGIYQTMPT